MVVATTVEATLVECHSKTGILLQSRGQGTMAWWLTCIRDVVLVGELRCSCPCRLAAWAWCGVVHGQHAWAKLMAGLLAGSRWATPGGSSS